MTAEPTPTLRTVPREPGPSSPATLPGDKACTPRPRPGVQSSVVTGPIEIRNIRDAHAFVNSAINRSWLVRPRDQHERDEITQEGVVILLELSERFDTHRDGYAKPGSFHGYAHKYLPLRLENAWLRLHREHRVYRTSEGRQMIEFGDAPDSIEARLTERPDAEASVRDAHRHVPHATDPEPCALVATGWRPPPRVHDAICHGLPSYLHDTARAVLQHLDDGYSVHETAFRLRMPRPDVDEIRGSIATALVQLEGEPRWSSASRSVPTVALTVPREMAA